jgi:amino acid transporter
MAEKKVEYERLGQAGLKFIDVVAQTVGFMGPVFGSILLIALVVGANNAGKGAGVATPFAILIAAIGIGALGWIIAAYARRIHAAGALYDYVSAGFGERTGFVFGWVYLGGLIVLSVAIPLLIGGLTSDFLNNAYGIGIPYWLLDFAYCVILFAVLFFGVRISTRAQLALVLFSASVVTIFILYIIIKGGHGGNSFKPFNPSEAGGVGNLFYGVLYAILLFVGFESAANLAEETSEPKRNIPRAVIVAIVVVGGYLLLASYAQAIGFGLDAAAWAGSAAQGPMIVLANPAPDGFGSSWFFDLMNILLILDIAAVGIGASVAATRLMFALARDRRIPGGMAAVSKKYGTPVATITFIVILSAIFIVIVRMSHGLLSRDIPGVPPNIAQFPEYFPLFNWFAGYGGLSLAVVYAAVALSGFRGLWGHVNQAALVVAGVLGFAISGLAIFSAVYKVPSPFNTVYWVLIGWAIIGILILVSLVGQGKFRLSAQGAGAITAGQEAAGHLETGVAPPGPEVRPEF